MDIIELIAEAIRPDGGWVAVGEPLQGDQWIVVARLGRSVWIRKARPDQAVARFLDWGNLRADGEGLIVPDGRLVVHDPSRFRIDPEAIRRNTKPGGSHGNSDP